MVAHVCFWTQFYRWDMKWCGYLGVQRIKILLLKVQLRYCLTWHEPPEKVSSTVSGCNSNMASKFCPKELFGCRWLTFAVMLADLCQLGLLLCERWWLVPRRFMLREIQMCFRDFIIGRWQGGTPCGATAPWDLLRWSAVAPPLRVLCWDLPLQVGGCWLRRRDRCLSLAPRLRNVWYSTQVINHHLMFKKWRAKEVQAAIVSEFIFEQQTALGFKPALSLSSQMESVCRWRHPQSYRFHARMINIGVPTSSNFIISATYCKASWKLSIRFRLYGFHIQDQHSCCLYLVSPPRSCARNWRSRFWGASSLRCPVSPNVPGCSRVTWDVHSRDTLGFWAYHDRHAGIP